MKLSERAMLVSLSIRSWDAKRTDKNAAKEIADHHKVAQSRLGVRKEAIDTKAPSYQALKSAMSEMRNLHYDLTLPWGRDGSQILTTKMFEDYCTKMRACQAKIRKALADFAADYPALKAQAAIDLNGLYNESDYPANIKAKFACDFEFCPIPDASDFRCKIPDGAVDEIREQISAANEKIVERAMHVAYERLYNHITRMVERLSDPEGRFAPTLVDGLIELCQNLPGLNLTGDKRLEQLRKQAASMIDGISFEELRDDKKVRRSVAKQARDIQGVMAQFMGAKDTEAEDAA